MALYLDLQPSPQFDRSLITYCVINFQRIKDVLARASMRVAVTNAVVVGPWPQNMGFNAPFKCDATFTSTVTMWGVAFAQTIMMMKLDNALMSPFMELFANSPGNHFSLGAVHLQRGLIAGAHNLRVENYSNVGSDGNDRWAMGAIFVEVP